ncbi:phosphoadenylyl-sulfate reductase [Hydrogenobacter thermophilus]|uniref:phosphoadenylyl-sulfate reductase n=1 Tax=Hydrogenobacter thermophilus TaxID=940 RepID=UPI0031F308AF
MLYPALAGGAPPFDELELHELAIDFEDKTPQELIAWALENFHPRLYIAWSGQVEDMVLLDMAWRINPEVRVFMVDTGRLHEETYRLAQEVEERYCIRMEVYFPKAEDVEKLVGEHGINCFYKSVELRHLCCHVRKVRPLIRALSCVDAWITGLRREQWASRHNIMKIEMDHDHGQIVKINPLADWTERDVWEYIKRNYVPYNRLYEKGYRSIGCEPCTKAVAPFEDPRAGRWWWEKDAPKECGMHCSIETGGFEKIADKLLREARDGDKGS